MYRNWPRCSRWQGEELRLASLSLFFGGVAAMVGIGGGTLFTPYFQGIRNGVTVLRSDWPFVPVPANVLRLRISVVRPVDKLIRRFDPVANGVELTIQFIVRIYGHN